MKKIDLKCPSCGAMMNVSEDKTEVLCPYCKYKFLLSKEPDIVELTKREEQLSYARETGERRAIEDSIKRQKKRKLLITLIIILIVFSLGAGGLVSTYLSLEYMPDPFKCVSIEFVGIDGDGQAKVTDSKACENYVDIQYSLSKNTELKEGEEITVTVSSGKYRFGTYSKEYTVSGLSKYLVDLNNLTDEILVKLHNYSYNHLSVKAFGSSFSGEVVRLEPYKVYLYTNGEDENVLYDVYKTDIKTPTGKIYEKFVVAYYEDFILLNSSELFSYSKLYHCGGVIKAGDPNVLSVLNKDYVGNIVGFESIGDFKIYMNEGNDGTFEIKEK